MATTSSNLVAGKALAAGKATTGRGGLTTKVATRSARRLSRRPPSDSA
ncbi:MAG: hypothetical protein U0232_23385 [Thermomicrobiales bacterium]